jgi:FKBP-type peptidyl-prolyl cis-trans isomerase
MPAGVKVEEITFGAGALAGRGTVVTIHYRGLLRRGDPFRSSYDEGRPLRFLLGKRRPTCAAAKKTKAPARPAEAVSTW